MTAGVIGYLEVIEVKQAVPAHRHSPSSALVWPQVVGVSWAGLRTCPLFCDTRLWRKFLLNGYPARARFCYEPLTRLFGL